MDLSAITNHVTPETIGLAVLWLVSEVVGAAKGTRATGVIHLVWIGLQAAAQATAKKMLPTSVSIDEAAIRAAVEEQVRTQVEAILKPIAAVAIPADSVNPPAADAPAQGVK